MARSIHCTLVETPATSDPYVPGPRGFNDLVPWADPYIATLLERLGHAAAREEQRHRLRGELPPPLDKDHRDEPWQADWSPRNWPRG